MEWVERVTRLDPSHLRWLAQTEDGPREWDTSLTVDLAARIIGWSHGYGRERSMTITFAPLEGNSCWMVGRVEVDTEGIPEGDIAEALRRSGFRLERDMRAARDRIEAQFQESTHSRRSCRA